MFGPVLYIILQDAKWEVVTYVPRNDIYQVPKWVVIKSNYGVEISNGWRLIRCSLVQRVQKTQGTVRNALGGGFLDRSGSPAFTPQNGLGHCHQHQTQGEGLPPQIQPESLMYAPGPQWGGRGQTPTWGRYCNLWNLWLQSRGLCLRRNCSAFLFFLFWKKFLTQGHFFHWFF